MNPRKYLLVIALAAAAATAHAQPKPALVQDRDEPARNPYMQEVVHSGCNGVALCIVEVAPAVPAGKRLVVTQVSITTQVSGGSTVPTNANLGDTTTGSRVGFTLVGSSVALIGTQTITRYYEAGATPVVTFALQAGTVFGNVWVVLLGYYITL